MRRFFCHKATLVLAVAAVLSLQNLQARNWYVKAEAGTYSATLDGSTWDKAFSNLVYAMDNAVSGDIIYVGGGTYNAPNRGWNQPSLTLKSGVSLIGGYNSATPTILNNSTSGVLHMITVAGGNDTARISNITLRTSVADGNNEGGAVYANGANVKLVMTNCNFETARSSYSGAAMHVGSGAFVRVENSNIANGQSARGGAFSVVNATLHLYNSKVHNNTATGIGYGGAFFINGGNVKVVSSEIYENSVSGSGRGGAVYLTNGSTMVLENSTIVNNTSVGGGAGFYLDGTNTLSLSYCSMVGNNNLAWGAGAIGASNTSNVSISNSVISNNSTIPGATQYGAFGDDIPPNVDIDIGNSLIGNDLVVNDSTRYNNLINSDSIAVGDSGKVTVNVPTTITLPDGTIINPIDDGNGEANIGAVAAPAQPKAMLVSGDSTVCIGDNIVLTASVQNMSGQKKFALYSVNGAGGETLLFEISNLHSSVYAFNTLIPAGATAVMTYRVKVMQGSKAPTAEVKVFVLPPSIAGKIEHARNVNN